MKLAALQITGGDKGLEKISRCSGGYFLYRVSSLEVGGYYKTSLGFGRHCRPLLINDLFICGNLLGQAYNSGEPRRPDQHRHNIRLAYCSVTAEEL